MIFENNPNVIVWDSKVFFKFVKFMKISTSLCRISNNLKKVSQRQFIIEKKNYIKVKKYFDCLE